MSYRKFEKLIINVSLSWGGDYNFFDKMVITRHDCLQIDNFSLDMLMNLVR